MAKRLIYLASLLLVLSSCRSLNPSRMFKTPEIYPYADLVNEAQEEYKIRPFDEINFNMLPNNGAQLYDESAKVSGPNSIITSQLNHVYTIDRDGYINLPVIGKVFLKGYTLKQARYSLEKKLADYYVKPYVTLRIMNQQAFVFQGSRGQVVTLHGDNVQLIEVLAMAGGITELGKAYEIKLVRGDLRNPKVQPIDLSTIEGVKRYGGINIQPNDIIYIDMVRNPTQSLVSYITPFVSILTVGLLIYQIATQ